MSTQHVPIFQPSPQIHVHATPSQALPAVVNLFFPPFGYLIQGRAGMFFVMLVLWILSLLAITILVGLVTTPLLWLFGIVNAASYRPPR